MAPPWYDSCVESVWTALLGFVMVFRRHLPTSARLSKRLLRAFALLILALVLVSGLSLRVMAQEGSQQVLDLNREAMAAYTNLDIQGARKKLDKALKLAKKKKVGGEALARTYLNMAVIEVAGAQNTALGLEHCINALKADPQIQLDPLVSTPEVKTVFQLAQRKVKAVGGGKTPPSQAPPAGGGGNFEGPGNIPHVPVPEQLSQTAVPVFIEVPEDAPVGPIYLFYKGVGMKGYKRVRMQRVSGGVGFEIPCADVFEPRIQYYIVAYGEDNAPIGFAGTPQEPVEVPIVTERTHPEPSLPGRAPPQQCTMSECPPGLEGCNNKGTRGGPNMCSSDSDCGKSLVCDHGVCTSARKRDRKNQPPRFFFHLGGTVGVGYASAGRPADADPNPAPAAGQDSPYIRSGASTDDACSLGNENAYCVRVVNPGLVPNFAIKSAIGYYIIPRLAAALTFRYQPKSGEGTLSAFMIGLRAQVLVTKPKIKGFNLALFAGSSYGQIQLQPDQGGGPEPYILSGLNSVQIGGVAGWRFTRNFGIQISPELNLLFPTFLMNVDTTLGIEVGF